MDPFEQLFRYAWWLDYGKSPEQSVRDLGDELQRKITPSILQCELSKSHFVLSASEMIKQFHGTVTTQANKNKIDARAIAGAITWEYEQNWKGRFSDYFQAPGLRSATSGLGWGSIHTPAARSVRPRANDVELLCQRMEASPAIALVAEFMDKMATLYFDESDGIWIRDCPEMLAFVFNTGNDATKRSANGRKDDPNRGTGTVSLDVSPNAMASWVHRNISRFASFQTTPTAPANAIRVTIGKFAQPKPTPSTKVDWTRKMCCFPCGTPVHTPHGPKPIETLERGAFIYTYDSLNARIVTARVDRRREHRQHNFKLARIEIANGKTLFVTDGHRFADQRREYWAPTEMLHERSILATLNDDVQVRRKSRAVTSCRRVHNLEIDRHHTYFVGDQGFLVRDW